MIILHLEISDWNEEIEDPRIFDIHEKCFRHILEETPFNYSLTNIDMAAIVLITTTKEDLLKYGLEFLDTPILSPKLCPRNGWRKYNPGTWRDPEENGRFFRCDEYYLHQLWLCVDSRGYEYMTNYYPHRKDEWDPFPDTDFFNSFDDEGKPIFQGYLNLPTGFIESWLGRKLSYLEEPVEYKTYNFEDLDLWGEK